MTKIVMHQGDVALVEAGEITADVHQIPLTDGAAVLAHGETTGHSHHVIGPRVAYFRDDGAGGGGTYIKPEAAAKLEHGTLGRDGADADHDALVIPPTTWEVRRQVVWSDDQEPRIVVD